MISRVKTCAQCDAENEEEKATCQTCGALFPSTSNTVTSREKPLEPPIPPLEELADLDMGFEMVTGFSRPDWPAICTFLREKVPKYDWAVALDWVVEQWLKELAADLGGASRVCQSRRFFCLSDADPVATQNMLDFAESAVNEIRGYLKSAAWTGFHGRHVLLLFADQEDYYAYTSCFDLVETNILSGGVFIADSYAHIAMPMVDLHTAQSTLAHELTHNLLCHLRIPRWLNEGLAMTIQGRIDRRGFLLDPDFADRQRAYWNEGNIQSFWAGKSYNIPGDSSQLSYGLGQILVNILTGTPSDFIEFIKHADQSDGGQHAAVTFLNLDLGQLLGGFLGPGNWRPRRKAIADCWNDQAVP